MGRDKDSERPQETYIAIANVKNLPGNIPMDTNPREQNLKTKVAKRIQSSLLTDRDMNFHLLNRGMVISAEKVAFNNQNSMLKLVFSNLEKHGDVDGGHTYKIILENRDQLEFPQFVRLEIMTGVEEFFEELAGARNTSVQVQDKSLAELEHKFQIIKDALRGNKWAEQISYKENAEGDVDITEVIAVLSMFNIERYWDNNHPVITYSSKKKCVDNYLEDWDKPNNPFVKLSKIAPDIFKLYSYIEERLPVVYNDKDGGGKYGRVKGVIYKENRNFHKLVFSDYQASIAYESPKGFIYPILAAFRVLVKENSNTGFYEWVKGFDPLLMFDSVDSELVLSTVDRSRSLGNNPQSVGKDSGHWAQMYMTVRNKYLEKMVNMLSK